MVFVFVWSGWVNLGCLSVGLDLEQQTTSADHVRYQKKTPCVLPLPHLSLSTQDLVRKGIPHHFRAIVWQLLCNAQNMAIKDQYSDLLKMTSPCEKLIRRDIARTYPEHEFFKEKDSLGQEVLFNVMKV